MYKNLYFCLTLVIVFFSGCATKTMDEVVLIEAPIAHKASSIISTSPIIPTINREVQDSDIAKISKQKILKLSKNNKNLQEEIPKRTMINKNNISMLKEKENTIVEKSKNKTVKKSDLTTQNKKVEKIKSKVLKVNKSTKKELKKQLAPKKIRKNKLIAKKTKMKKEEEIVQNSEEIRIEGKSTQDNDIKVEKKKTEKRSPKISIDKDALTDNSIKTIAKKLELTEEQAISDPATKNQKIQIEEIISQEKTSPKVIKEIKKTPLNDIVMVNNSVILIESKELKSKTSEVSKASNEISHNKRVEEIMSQLNSSSKPIKEKNSIPKDELKKENISSISQKPKQLEKENLEIANTKNKEKRIEEIMLQLNGGRKPKEEIGISQDDLEKQKSARIEELIKKMNSMSVEVDVVDAKEILKSEKEIVVESKKLPIEIVKISQNEDKSPDRLKVLPIIKTLESIDNKLKLSKKEKNSYYDRKSVGDRVCRDANGLLNFLCIDFIAEVKDVKKDKIKVNIIESQCENTKYNGIGLYKNTILWDDYYHWKICN